MSKIAKATIGLMIVTMLSKVLGFGRELVLGATYGTSIYSDIYITSINIPTVVFSAIGAALSTTFIPLYYENSRSTNDRNSLEFTNNIINIVIIISTIIAILCFLFADKVVRLFAVGFTGEVFNTTVKFTKIMIFGGVFIGISNIMTSVLQINSNFIIPGLISIPYNIIIIISIVLSIKINKYILPIGTLIAMLSQLLFQIPAAYKYGYRYNIKINIREDYVKKMIWLVGPVFIGVSVNQINAMVDRTLASTLTEGSISALNYANKLNGFIMALFIATLGAVIYPKLSKLSSRNDKVSFIETIVSSVNILILIIIPISVGAMVLSKPIISILFERGAFDTRATNMTSIALVYYSIGMVAFGLRDILGKVFYSIQDTKTPMINGSISMCMNIILNIGLVKIMGHSGLALGTSLSSLICIMLLFNSLNKKIGYYGQDKILITAIKSLIASVIMGVVTLFIYKYVINLLEGDILSQIISIFISVIVSVFVYLFLIFMMRVNEINKIKKLNILNHNNYINKDKAL